MDNLETLDQELENNGLAVEDFDEIPSRSRSGGGGRHSPVMDAIRNLGIKKRLVIKVPIEDDFKKVAASRSAGLSVANLPFRAKVRTDKGNRLIYVYREEGSDYTEEQHPTADRKMTVAEVNERNARRKAAASTVK